MSADRELLEWAAKAAGMLVLLDGAKWPKEKVGWFFNQVGGNPPALYDRASLVAMWAPLTDDGDLLRLARAAKINIDYDDCCAWRRGAGGPLYQEFWGGECGDEAHAILAVAAAIGKAMP